jgi:salicylate hydroxylase
MGEKTLRSVTIAGAGIAGLTAALAFARRGCRVRVFEQARQFETVGAGIQLSPNATRILARLGVLDLLAPHATCPPAALLKDAATLRLLARVPLGEIAERRWGAPYLVVHRADLQAALLAAVAREPSVALATDARVTDARMAGSEAAATVQSGASAYEERSGLVIGADGVWSALRPLLGGGAECRFSGELAWRTTVEAGSEAGRAFSALTSVDCVTTFLHAGFHLVAYPVKADTAYNLVAFTPGRSPGKSWAGNADTAELARAMRGTDKALRDLVEKAGHWTQWPVNTVDARRPWTRRGHLALIGDAAHAMTPFAAQGAAMAIEDAETLADRAAASRSLEDLPELLWEWEVWRKARVAKVARRGALNRLAWHAAGPVAVARDLILKARPPARLAADLDWLYGWDPAKRHAPGG